MKKFIILSILAGIVFPSVSQDAVKILKQSYAKCQSVTEGYYEMDHYMKYMSENDTVLSRFNCFFRKLPADSIFNAAFHYQYMSGDSYKRDILYTGDDFVRYSLNDSLGVIMSMNKWADEIKSNSHNYTLFTPLTMQNSFPLPTDTNFTDIKRIYKYIGEDEVYGKSCYHIKVNVEPDNKDESPIHATRIEYNYWIGKQDSIPIKYSIEADLVMNNDTMYQHEKNLLTKYKLYRIDDQTPLTLLSIPPYIKIKDYSPEKEAKLLPSDTIAPAWRLPSLQDDTVSLSDLWGNVVLVDFFYKSCYPCMQALPALQQLYEKYKDNGLSVIGINPFDTKEEGIVEFLAKRGITYTVLLGDRDVAKAYHVSAYPTIYLIDKEGKIITVQVGFGDGVEAKLENIILGKLK